MPGMSGLCAMNGVGAVSVHVMREAIVHAMKAANACLPPSATVPDPKAPATSVVQSAAVVPKKRPQRAPWRMKPPKPPTNPLSNP